MSLSVPMILEQQFLEGKTNNTSQETQEVKTRQFDYNDKIKLLEEALTKFSLNEPNNLDKFWESVERLAKFCNSASEYFMKLGLNDIAYPYLCKALEVINSIKNEKIRKNKDWKIMKIKTIKHLANLHQARGEQFKVYESLKKIVKLQRDLERTDEIILPGAEFTYINLADITRKQKNWPELSQYAKYAVTILEKQLEIKKGIPILDNQPITNDDKMLIVHSKKFITLSYAYYLLSKALLKQESKMESIAYLEKAHEIAKKYLGPKDKITLNYQKKIKKIVDNLKLPNLQGQKSMNEQSNITMGMGTGSPNKSVTNQNQEFNAILDKMNLDETPQQKKNIISGSNIRSDKLLASTLKPEVIMPRPDRPVTAKNRNASSGSLFSGVPFAKNMSVMSNVPDNMIESNDLVIVEQKGLYNKTASTGFFASPKANTLSSAHNFSSFLSKGDTLVKEKSIKNNSTLLLTHTRAGSANFGIRERNFRASAPLNFDKTEETMKTRITVEVDNFQNPDSFIKKDNQSILRPFLTTMAKSPAIMFMNQRPNSGISTASRIEMKTPQNNTIIQAIDKAVTQLTKPNNTNSFFSNETPAPTRPISAKTKPTPQNQSMSNKVIRLKVTRPQTSKRTPSPILLDDISQDTIEQNKQFLDMMGEWDDSGSDILDQIKAAKNEKEKPKQPIKRKNVGKISGDLANYFKDNVKQQTKEKDPNFRPFEKKNQQDYIKEEDQKMHLDQQLTENLAKIPEKIEEQKPVEIEKGIAKIAMEASEQQQAKQKMKEIRRLRRLKDNAARIIQQAMRRWYENKKKQRAQASSQVQLDEADIMANRSSGINQLLIKGIPEIANNEGLPTATPKIESHDQKKIIKSNKGHRDDINLEKNNINPEDLFRYYEDNVQDYFNKKKNVKEEKDIHARRLSFEVEEEYLLVKQEDQNIGGRKNLLKKNLASLKDYNISFYGHYFERTGQWTLAYRGLIDMKHMNNMILVFYLCHGGINQPFFINADIKTSEVAMFQSTIWSVISANMGKQQIKDADSSKTFLIIKGLKKENFLNEALRIRKEELESLREFVIKVTKMLEEEYFLHRKTTGYVYAKKNEVANSDFATRNRRYLYLSQAKIQKELRKMITQFNTFYTGTEKYGVKLLPTDDYIYKTLIVPQKTGLISSESEEDSLSNKNRMEINDGKLDVKAEKKKKLRQNSMNPRRPSGFKKQADQPESEKPQKDEETGTANQEVVFKNPFTSDQIVIQSIIKKDLHYALVTFKVRFPKIANERVRDRDHIIFVIDLEQLDTTSKWRGQCQITLRELAEKITSFKLELKDFMMNCGFNNWQRKFMSSFVNECITVKDSQLEIKIQSKLVNQILVTEKIEVLNNPKSEMQEIVDNFEIPFVPSFALKETAGYIYNQHNILREEKDLQDRIQDLKSEHTTIHSPPAENFLSPHSQFEQSIKGYDFTDAEYGMPGNYLDKINIVGILSTMKHYNTFKILKADRYYLTLERKYENILIRLDLMENVQYTSMRIGIYHFNSNIIDFIDIIDKRIQEKIINILQMGEDDVKESALNKIFEYTMTLVGKKLCLQEKAKVERYNKKIDITPNKIAQILLTNSDETLPKYKLDIQQHFTKGFITNLGHCYIGVKTYFIKSLYKFDNIFCIRFEISPFLSKTKVYKFLINSKDIKLFMNVDYPLENPYRNWDTIVNIIDNLVLKKKMVYNSIELPLANPSFRVIPIQKYNLKNIITQSIESPSQTTTTIFGNFLHRRIQENKIILQMTKKINNTFIIITIEKHIILDYWTFNLYIPKYCRRFITSIYASDINTFNSHFLESLYAVSATKIDANKKNFTDYSKFSSEYTKLTTPKEEIKIMKTLQRKQSLSDSELNEIIFQEREKKKKSQRDDADYEEIKRKFIEIKFWENIVKNTNIEKTKANNYILYLDNFRGILREYVHDEVVQTSDVDEALIEIFLESTHKKYDMFTGIPQIPDIYVENHDLLLRITSLARMNTYNNRFKLDQIIKLYNEDNIANKLPLFNPQRKLSLSRVKLLAEYMIYKIKNWKLVPITKEDVEKKKPLNKETLLPWANYSLKLNCNFDIQERIDDQHLFIDKVLIFRGILTTNPLQLVSFVFNEKKDDIWVYIYDIGGCWSIRKVIRMDDVIANVPYARTMLEKKLHKQVGEKMFRAFKNSLIIHSFLYQKKVIP